ncbi:phosphatase PAP2 family protein [Marinilabiliaceae bacterium JC017]|nr:phosphatase PAP2 family protein [Marinilabiliaceae bacterium JC017]
MKETILLGLWLLVSIIQITGQAKEIRQYSFEKSASFTNGSQNHLGLLLPITLASAGIAFEYFGSQKKWWLNKHGIQYNALKTFPGYTYSIDDYLQFIPIVLVYGLNTISIPNNSIYICQTVRLLTAELLCTSTVHLLKNQTSRLRPDGSVSNSFPSGHTAQAFLAARFLDKEYGKRFRWVRWMGYSMAATTGVCRILKNKHWISDVLLGAGIGFLSVDLSYFLHDKLSKKKLAITPIKREDVCCISLTYNF